MKSGIGAITIVFAAAIAATAGVPGRVPGANACSLASPRSHFLLQMVEHAPALATGRFEAVSEWEAVFVVEEVFKGVAAGDRLPFDNREPGLSASCGTYADDAPGNRFAEGDRRLIFLEGPVDGLWRIGISGIGALAVQDDPLAPLAPD